MHTGIISLANRVSFNIKSNDFKDIILNRLNSLYKIKIIQKHYFNLSANNTSFIKNNLHLCCLRSNGNPYYIFFTLYNDIPIIYFIDKKIHPNYQKPRIILVRGLFDISLYKNTLLDGEMIKTYDNKWEFVINDIISYEGTHLTNVTLPNRLKIIYDLLENKYTPDETIDVCKYKVKTYFNLYKKSINELISLSEKLNYTSRGIYLWPYKLSYKPILYNFNQENIINVVRKVKDETTFKTLENISIPINSTIVESYTNNIDNSANIKLDNSIILWITKTDEPDVYKLYNNENVLSEKDIGIAYVPNLATSKMLRTIFKNKNASASIKFNCIYIEKFKKWQPISIV